jgi:hypothetical protein
MRSTLVLLTTAFLALAAGPALAHDTHGPCTTSKTLVDTAVVHVDLYSRSCAGATVASPIAWCAGTDLHVLSGVHAPVLYGNGCETGVLLAPITLLA